VVSAPPAFGYRAERPPRMCIGRQPDSAPLWRRSRRTARPRVHIRFTNPPESRRKCRAITARTPGRATRRFAGYISETGCRSFCLPCRRSWVRIPSAALEKACICRSFSCRQPASASASAWTHCAPTRWAAAALKKDPISRSFQAIELLTFCASGNVMRSSRCAPSDDPFSAHYVQEQHSRGWAAARRPQQVPRCDPADSRFARSDRSREAAARHCQSVGPHSHHIGGLRGPHSPLTGA
jgi:hypothetical protein